MVWIIGAHTGVDVQAYEAYNRGVSMLFTENVGQLSDDVVFYSMHPTTVYVLKDGSIHINGIRLSFGARPKFVTGDMPLKTRISYFGRGKAISNVPTYKRIVLKEVYPKIDAILTADGRGIVEFQFIVHPGGDPGRIKVETEGKIEVREGNIYVVKDEKEVVRISDLRAYQGAEEIEVQAMVGGKNLRFNVGRYDRMHTLIIDPVATAILTSSGIEMAHAVAVDANGNVFVTGWTNNHSDFAPSRTVFGSAVVDTSVFVSKLSNDLNTHIATAILSSSGVDMAYSVAIDGSGDVFVAGNTYNSVDFAPSRTLFGISGLADVFVSKLNNDLNTHIATAIIASSDHDLSYSLALDASGDVFVVGYTWGPTNFAPSRTVFGTSGSYEAFVTKLSNDLSSHMATAILASSGGDVAFGVDVDGSGNVFVAGWTSSSGDFAPSRTVFGTAGWIDAFVSKMNNDLSAHISTAILTSSYDDYARAVVVDASDNVFVAGYTGNSTEFAPSRNVFGTSGNYDAFVSKLNNGLDTHVATAILCSSSDDDAYGVTVGSSGSVFVAGFTPNYMDFAPTRTVFGTTGGWGEAFMSEMDANLSTHISTSIIASSSIDRAYSVAVDVSGNIFVAGYTGNYSDFAPSRTVFGTTGGSDAFVTRFDNPALGISERSEKMEPAIVKVSEGNITFTLSTSSYVGYDVYLADGRLIKRVSLGYLPAGRYEYRLDIPKGAYLLKVRVGNEVRKIKSVM